MTCPSSALSQCSGAPSGFCCDSSSNCLLIASQTTVLCCPKGEDCSIIEPITCDISQQNVTSHPLSSLYTTNLTAVLPSCGSACCPLGFICQNSVCVLNTALSNSTSSTSSSSTATVIKSTSSPHPTQGTSTGATPASSTSTSSSSSSTNTLASSSSAPIFSSSSSPNRGIAAVAATLSIVSIILLSVFFFFFFQKRRRRRQSRDFITLTSTATLAEARYEKAELSTEQEVKRRTLARQVELDGKPIWVMKNKGEVPEMPMLESEIVELPATPVKGGWGGDLYGRGGD